MRLVTLSIAAILAASAAHAVDDCLLGTWQADLNDLADILGGQMQGNAKPVGGVVQMAITPDGQANINVNNMVLNVTVPGAPAMDVSVNGVSSGAFNGEGGRWSVVTASYNLVGSADVMGQRMDIPFQSSTGMFGGGAGSYSCGGTALEFLSDSAQPRIPRRWVRVG